MLNRVSRVSPVVIFDWTSPLASLATIPGVNHHVSSIKNSKVWVTACGTIFSGTFFFWDARTQTHIHLPWILWTMSGENKFWVVLLHFIRLELVKVQFFDWSFAASFGKPFPNATAQTFWDCILHVMSTPDLAKNHGLWQLGGHSNSHNPILFYGTPPIKQP